MARGARVLVAVLLLVAPAACAARFDVDGERAYARVVHQVEAGPRIPGSAGHRAVREWLIGEIARLGGRVSVQGALDTVAGRPLEITNIIARFGPSAGRSLVLGAHWDTRAASDQAADPAQRSLPVPGANDGASGVAVLLEVAELMSRRPPARPVDLVFFDGEDQGRAAFPNEFSRGARAFADSVRPLVAAGTGPQAAFIFDMVGDRDLGIYPEVISQERASNLVELVLEAARATGAVHFHTRARYAITDDHVPLLDAGVPAVDIIDFDYRAWHTPADLPDQVSPKSLAEVARVAAWIVYRSPLARPISAPRNP
ncbi:MAG: hypothetical protein A2W00_11175 [Candidatus Eisenbacteria bacterium RBG_16_71_46]|nr:MAG: hypothetical protein A2W00_11175 [Candidatus Eisenbacteria bacterium RBG_16_71_46]